MKTNLWAALALFLALAASPTRAETPSIRLTAPAYMLSDGNPLKEGKLYDGAVEVEIPGYRYDPPLEVPAAPRDWPPSPNVAEIDQILSHLQIETELKGSVRIHAEAFYRDHLLALVSIEGGPSHGRWVFALVQESEVAWRVDSEATGIPSIEALFAAWNENGWIEVIDTDLRGVDN
jgi:hypothetical protein